MRGNSGRAIARPSKRPIDKELIAVSQTLTNSQSSTTLKTTTFPCTVVGLRWDLSGSSSLTTGPSRADWAIVVVHDGLSESTMSTSDGSDFYTPEQDVLAFGSGRIMDADGGAGNLQVHWSGTTKTMRKLKQGDVLKVISLASNANAGVFQGIVQFFCKS